jgi:GDP/UDP-N,N'-diacetylbacillosamine 2-epimerase (hydrolysing)
MQEIKNDKSLKLQLLVSGMHLSREFGLTYKEIKKDSFSIDKKVNIKLDSDKPEALCRSMGLGLEKFARAYMSLNPDIVVILGDRFEAFAASTAAMICRLPIAHLHGGEATYGLIDEAIRHSITKMSHLHFTSTEEYRQRVIQLGEDPKRVFNVGAIGLDNIRGLKLLSRKELEHRSKFEFNKHNLLVTFHPVTLEYNTSKRQFRELLKALDGTKDTRIIFTKANADRGGRAINRMIDKYVSKKQDKAASFASMGQLVYLSVMKIADAVVGNSSSGIIEAPSLKTATINIGDRQKGRLKAKTIIDSAPERKAIQQALKKVYSAGFQASLRKVANPYLKYNTAKSIKAILTTCNLNGILKKNFYNLN